MRLKPSSKQLQVVVRSIAYSFIVSALALFAIAGGGLTFGRWLSSSAASQGHGTRPRPGPPEGTFPDLNEIRQRTHARARAPEHVPSTTRSRRSPLVPWNGIRVGDPLSLLGKVTSPINQFTHGSSVSSALTQAVMTKSIAPAGGGAARQMNHAQRAMRMPAHRAYVAPPVSESEYTQNFFQVTLLRQPNTNESIYWNDMVRAAYAHGQGSMVIAFKELGKTLFESNEYAARNRDNHGYVYDLYKTYLMREPDQAGWDYWTSVVPTNGRANVRRAFDLCSEFANLVAALTPSGSASSAVSSLATARVDPFNQPGSGLLARDAEWSVPLLSLPGRAGLDLGLSLSYSSMVWTRTGPYIYFDEDNGFPSPGFQLGFPTIQEKVFDAQVGQNVYVLVTAAGTRVELRQTGTSNVYEAADSSYLQLVDYGTSLLVRSTDGTQLTYVPFNAEYRCTQIKDRNGNKITVNNDALGHITNITDTLGRVITFNYDGNANLLSITQSWNGSTHTWASFVWGTHNMSSSFSGASMVGAPDGSVTPVITRVGLDDGSYSTFQYTNKAQVSLITRYTSDDVQRAYIAYDYESPTDDCPRLWQTRVWAENWTGLNGVPSEVQTQYSLPGDGSHQVAAPDGTVYKEYYGTGWQKGVVLQSEMWSGGVRQKWTTLTWTQDNTGVSYQTNPRMTETNVYDAEVNRRRSTMTYAAFTLSGGGSCTLPTDAYEYAANAVTVLRRSHSDYNLDATYTDRRIIGLPAAQYTCDGAQGAVPCNDSSGTSLNSKVTFLYDEAGSVQNQGPATQHDDTNYGIGLVAGRANLSSNRRHNATNISQFTVSSVQYNTNGSAVAVTDALGHQSTVSYADSFSDSINRSSFAYPTTVTVALGSSSSLQYNYDFGAKTRIQGPPPANQSQGLIQTLIYDSAARIDKITTTNNSAYTRYIYGPNYLESYASVNNVADEARSVQTFDGLGRVIGAASNHPGSGGGYSTRNTVYDLMGRAIKQSNPTETNAQWVPAGDDVYNAQTGQGGWRYTQQTYDWKGRPRITTNTDNTTKEASYSGCGCAGGEVLTLTDETGRRQRISSDGLGRPFKTESLNWDATTYSTTVNTYNARDQVTLMRVFQGTEASGVYQDTTMTYDGHARLATQKTPDQTNATSYTYFADDTINVTTDARGATTSLGYNSRQLVTSVVYGGGYAAPSVTLGYDAAGNRTSMSDGLGSVSYNYDQLSRLTSETRQFADPVTPNLNGSFTLGYGYNLAGEMTTITEPSQFGSTVIYAYNTAGKVTDVTGTGGGASQYATGLQYRAWGGLKHLNYGNSLTLDLTYTNRLQAAQYDLKTSSGSWVMGQQYQYDSAGRISASTDLVNSNLNRSYSYDQVGRLSLGDTANGTNNGPFKQTYGHDVWGNLTSRSWRIFAYSPYCSCNYPTTNGASSTYANNKNTAAGWNHDADGRLLSSAENGSTFNYSYDAAGRMASATQPGKTMSQSFDGDGLRAKWIENGVVTYHVRSSALGGQTVTELDQYGAKKRGYVYAGGQEIAKQEGGQVLWDQRDVSGVSMRVTNSSGTVTSKIETDPLGTQVDDTQTYNQNGGSNGYGFNPNGFYGDPTMPNMGCSADGAPADCNWVQRQINSGAAAQCPPGGCGPTSINGQWYRYRHTDNGAGWMTNNQFFGVPATGPPTLGSYNPNRPRDNAIELPLRSPRSSSFNIAPQEPSKPSFEKDKRTACEILAATVQSILNRVNSKSAFLDELARTFTAARHSGSLEMNSTQNLPASYEWGSSGFQQQFKGPGNQVRHYVAGFIFAAHWGSTIARQQMNSRETPGRDDEDIALNEVSTRHGASFMTWSWRLGNARRNLSQTIRNDLCEK